MLNLDRVKLLFGPYRSPRCKLGRTLRCQIRGSVKVRGLTDARITRPFTRNRIGSRRPVFIRYSSCAETSSAPFVEKAQPRHKSSWKEQAARCLKSGADS